MKLKSISKIVMLTAKDKSFKKIHKSLNKLYFAITLQPTIYNELSAEDLQSILILIIMTKDLKKQFRNMSLK